MVKVRAKRREGYTHDVSIEGGHSLVIDEPTEAGGGDQGPSPTRTLAAALAACVAITLEMYADRKGWDLGAVDVEVNVDYEGATPSAFDVAVKVPGELTDEQRAKLQVIAGKCPVHKVIAGETPVEDRIEAV